MEHHGVKTTTTEQASDTVCSYPRKRCSFLLQMSRSTVLYSHSALGYWGFFVFFVFFLSFLLSFQCSQQRDVTPLRCQCSLVRLSLIKSGRNSWSEPKTEVINRALITLSLCLWYFYNLFLRCKILICNILKMFPNVRSGVSNIWCTGQKQVREGVQFGPHDEFWR